MYPKELDKSKGFAFRVDGIGFYNGLHGSGLAAEVDGKVLYISSPRCIAYSGDIKVLAKRAIKLFRLMPQGYNRLLS